MKNDNLPHALLYPSDDFDISVIIIKTIIIHPRKIDCCELEYYRNGSVVLGGGKRTESFFLYGAMTMYIILLFTLLLIGFHSPIGGFNGFRGNYRSVNLIPFRSILSYLSNPKFSVIMINNVLGNIAVFIPAGIYAAVIRKKGILINLFFVFAVSLFFEVMQYIFMRGTSDVDDILLNSFGGFIGILFYRGLTILLKNEEKARSAITVLSVIIGVPVFVFIMGNVLR